MSAFEVFKKYFGGYIAYYISFDPPTTPDVVLQSVQVSPAAVALTLSTAYPKYQLSLIGNYSNNTMAELPAKSAAWTSDNPDVATVGYTGLVTGIKVGSANITANYNGYKSQAVPATVSAGGAAHCSCSRAATAAANGLILPLNVAGRMLGIQHGNFRVNYK